MAWLLAATVVWIRLVERRQRKSDERAADVVQKRRCGSDDNGGYEGGFFDVNQYSRV
jgi:hypothetical protein